MYYKEKMLSCLTKKNKEFVLQMSNYSHICSIRGVNTRLLNFLAKKTSMRLATRHRGDVVNEALAVLALLYHDQRQVEGQRHLCYPLGHERRGRQYL